MRTDDKLSHASLVSYCIGFALSLILTIIPYQIVTKHLLEGNTLVVFVVGCAVLQLLVQLKFFLHLTFAPEGRENLYSFVFTLIILVIIVAGSLWIMHDLNYYMMDPVMEEHNKLMMNK